MSSMFDPICAKCHEEDTAVGAASEAKVSGGSRAALFASKGANGQPSAGTVAVTVLPAMLSTATLQSPAAFIAKYCRW